MAGRPSRKQGVRGDVESLSGFSQRLAELFVGSTAVPAVRIEVKTSRTGADACATGGGSYCVYLLPHPHDFDGCEPA